MNVKLLLGGGLALAAGVAGVLALSGSTVASLPFSRVAGSQGRVEIYGELDRASIRPLRGANLVTFDLVEEKTGQRLGVLYDNPASGLPNNFPAASHARAAGVYDPVKGKFVSDRVLTKCPSKYEGKPFEEHKAAVGVENEGA